MTAKRIREIGEKLRRFAEFARDEYFTREVIIEQDEYYVDLGDFGDRPLSVTLEEEKRFDAAEILDEYYPISTDEFDALAEELESVEDDVSSLDAALDKLEKEGAGALVAAIRSLVTSFKPQVDLTGLSVGPLPPKPIPWPGALRPEIDYTAPDFPLRYQPPPGYNWSKRDDISRPADPPEAYDVEFLREKTSLAVGCMILDNKGRISWIERDDDDLASGKRWAIWFLKRDGIPAGSGDFNGPTKPLAIDRYGYVISGDVTEVWPAGYLDQAKQRVREIIDEYDRSLQPTNGYGVTYDPRTVELGDQMDVRTEDLRVGDFVFSYGRVLSVARDSGTKFYRIVTDGCDGGETYFGDYSPWTIKSIVDRENQPTAISITDAKRAPQQIDYDPLTVPLKETETFVFTSELRLGDDIIGPSFGRVTKVNPDFTIEMNRDGEINTYTVSADQKWAVFPIDVPDRDAVPTAISLNQPVEPVEIPF